MTAGRVPAQGAEETVVVKTAPCGCQYVGHAGLRDVQVLGRCNRHRSKADRHEQPAPSVDVAAVLDRLEAWQNEFAESATKALHEIHGPRLARIIDDFRRSLR